MRSEGKRGLRIGLVAILAITITGSVVLSLEKSGSIVDIPPFNLTAYPSTVCLDSSAAQYVHLEAPAGAQYISLYGALPGAGHGPVPSGDWTVRFLANGEEPSKGAGYPGAPMLLPPLGGGAPIGPDFVVPGNLTPTGSLIDTLFGVEPQQNLSLNIPDVILPAGPIWVEIFQTVPGNHTNAKTCSPWLWQTGYPGNSTPLFALDGPFGDDDDDFVGKSAPGANWNVLGGALSLQIAGTADLIGACCTNGPGTASDCIETTRADCETNHSLFLGEGSLCADQTIECEMLVVEFDSVDVKAVRDGVLIEWTTSLEVDTAGFRVLRETKGRHAKSITPVSGLIHSVGAGLSGGSYTFLDNARESRLADAYYIEDLDLFGRWTRHGPFTVQRVRQAEPVFDSRSAGRSR